MWDGIHELHAVNELAGGGDLVFVGGSVDLRPGTENHGVRVGSILIEMPEGVDEFELSTVQMAVREGDDLVAYDIGDWNMTTAGPDAFAMPGGSYPGAMGDARRSASTWRTAAPPSRRPP